MVCNPRKDMTQCRAAAKFYPLEQRHFYTVYLWETREAMLAAADEDGCEACVCHVPYMERFETTRFARILGVLTRWKVDLSKSVLRFFPKLGEIHFYAGGWDNEIVTHECLHASLGLARAYRLSPTFVFDGGGELSLHLADWDIAQVLTDEEILCYLHGQLTDAVTKWLWKHDPSKKWARVAA